MCDFGFCSESSDEFSVIDSDPGISGSMLLCCRNSQHREFRLIVSIEILYLKFFRNTPLELDRPTCARRSSFDCSIQLSVMQNDVIGTIRLGTGCATGE